MLWLELVLLQQSLCLVEGFQVAVLLCGHSGIFRLTQAQIISVFFHISKNDNLLDPLN